MLASINTTLISIVAAIFTLGILILIHELGHFLAARSVGIRVERFSIGFPPRFLTFRNKFDGLWMTIYVPWFVQRLFNAEMVEYRFRRRHPKAGDTEYSVSWTPLGGYVKMSGTIDESLDTTIQGKPWEFTSKKKWQQLFVISAGVIMNTILAWLLFSTIFLSNGVGEMTGSSVVGSLSGTQARPIYPAEAAGIVPGDKILSVNDQKIQTWDDLINIIHSLPGKEVALQWEHEGAIQSATIKTVAENMPTDDGVQQVGMIGIGPEVTQRSVGFIEAGKLGIQNTYNFGTLMVRSLGMLISGEASVKELGGPVAIAKMAGDMARQGWLDVFYFMAILSVNLAFINILPIPGLDGGQFIIIAVEGIIRRPLPIRAKVIIQQVGMVILLGLVIFVTIQDIAKL